MVWNGNMPQTSSWPWVYVWDILGWLLYSNRIIYSWDGLKWKAPEGAILWTSGLCHNPRFWNLMFSYYFERKPNAFKQTYVNNVFHFFFPHFLHTSYPQMGAPRRNTGGVHWGGPGTRGAVPMPGELGLTGQSWINPNMDQWMITGNLWEIPVTFHVIYVFKHINI